MKKYQIAICDDEEFYVEDICQYFKAYESERDVVFEVSKYNNPLELIKNVNDGKKFDIMILDVEMPEKSGVELAQEIRTIDKEVVICFATSHPEYAYGAFQVNAIGYLLKPVAYAPLKEIFDKCLIQIRYLRDYKFAQETYIKIKSIENRENIITIDDILYLEKQRNRCLIHLKDGEAVCYETLAHMYDQLDHSKFFYVHQGYIVNFNYIKEVLPDSIRLSDKISIPCSRKYYKEMKERHMDKIFRVKAEMEKRLEMR